MGVSVVIPAKNAAGTIAPTLESLRAQSYADWEATVVDDRSDDDTAGLVTYFAAEEPRITLARGEGKGVSSARNRVPSRRPRATRSSSSMPTT